MHRWAACTLLIVPMLCAAAGGGTGAKPAQAASTGTGPASEPARVSSVVEAEAAYNEAVRKCRLLAVAGVRDECLRQAKRNLDQDLARLRSGRP